MRIAIVLLIAVTGLGLEADLQGNVVTAILPMLLAAVLLLPLQRWPRLLRFKRHTA